MKYIFNASVLLFIALIYAGCGMDDINTGDLTDFPPGVASISPSDGQNLTAGESFEIKAVFVDSEISPLSNGTLTLLASDQTEIASLTSAMAGTRDSLILTSVEIDSENLAEGVYTISYSVSDTKGQVSADMTSFEIFGAVPSRNIGIIGSATPNGWDADTDMSLNPDGTYGISIELVAGETKFREDDDWTVNWGSTDFPSGVGTQDGDNIPIPEGGNYDVLFNPETGAYSFVNTGGGLCISIVGSATAGGDDNPQKMFSGEGGIWELEVQLRPGELRFFDETDEWGSDGFPNGTATIGGGSIPVDNGGTYKITFDPATGDYEFSMMTTSGVTIGIIGSATPGGWDEDTDMTMVGDNMWELEIELVDGEAKFRANDAWDLAWGASDFPSGTGLTEPGSANIPVPAGTYLVTFNDMTGEYNFGSAGGIQSIGIIGSATPGGWDSDTDMTMVSDNMWELEIELVDGEAKFRANDAWDLAWGASDFPSGTGSSEPGSDNIPVPAGTYLVTFNDLTGEYNFGEPGGIRSIGIIGSATPGGWDSDTDMTLVSDNMWELEIELVDGEAKFRANDAWDLAWGASDFPSGTGLTEPGSANIPVPAGTYLVTFNDMTGEYNFGEAGGIQSIGIIGSATPGGWDSDTDMTEVGDNMWELEIELVEGEAKFRANDAWDLAWGASDFPSGTGSTEPGSANIPVPAGTYLVTFNDMTGEYSFDPVGGIVSIGVIGSATPGGWDSDTDMTNNGDGTWTLNIDLVDGEAKFRANDAWDLAWGALDFPSGIGSSEPGSDNIPVPAGNYTITFNSDTGEYNFQ